MAAALLFAASATAQIRGDGSMHPMGLEIDYPGSQVKIPAGDGMRSGPNLFHSFETFHIAEGGKATFTPVGNAMPGVSIDHVIARHDILERLTIPRELAELELAVRKATHARDMLRATSSMQVEESSHALAQAELALARQERTLSGLLRDRDALTIVAPIDGRAIAGHYRGEWLALDESARRLRPASDVWSIGASFYSVLADAFPREFKRGVDPIRTILDDVIVPIDERVEGVPGPLARIINRSILSDPETRYSSATEFLQDFEDSFPD